MDLDADKKEPDSFASRLRRYRGITKMTLTELADAAGISRTYLWELENGEGSGKNPSVAVAKQLAGALSIGLMDLVGYDASPFPRRGGTIQQMRRPIAEDWLIVNGFRIDEGRNDPRMPVRSLAIGREAVEQRTTASPDDLCIDVAPVDATRKDWFVWIARRDPYCVIHVRYMQETNELIRLYEGLTGRVWPGTL